MSIVVDYKIVNKIFHEKYGNLIKKSYRDNVISLKDKKYEHALKEECIIFEECGVIFHNYDSIELFYVTESDFIRDIIALCKSIPPKVKEGDTSVSLVITNREGGLSIKSIILKDNDFSLHNYNKDFEETHNYIQKSLAKDRTGVYLFHGDPGTGKTNYIKYLAKTCSKKFIIVSSTLTHQLDSPNFLTLLLENQNCILVIEDAEKIICSREKDSYSPITSLLNLSDGFIGQAINLQIICTFNTHLSKVDSALLRKGRLIREYEFKKLDIDCAQNLLDIQEKSYKAEKAMSLAEIYNIDELECTLQKQKGAIGFAR